MNRQGAGDQIRQISIAVADWLCGTLEGMTSDNADVNLAEALDYWLRVQKKNSETLFIGSFICTTCEKPWDGLALSPDKNSFQCPHCGSVQKIASSIPKLVPDTPQNIDALRMVQQNTEEIVSKIEMLNNLIMKSQGVKQ
jgi:predicted RNA-binding Zn-ribbon protein involved in translation (DUF1610 family)